MKLQTLNLIAKGGLSREQMKSIGGGLVPGLTCWCGNGGGFSSRPGLTDVELIQIEREYCGDSGASCSPSTAE